MQSSLQTGTAASLKHASCGGSKADTDSRWWLIKSPANAQRALLCCAMSKHSLLPTWGAACVLPLVILMDVSRFLVPCWGFCAPVVFLVLAVLVAVLLAGLAGAAFLSCSSSLPGAAGFLSSFLAAEDFLVLSAVVLVAGCCFWLLVLGVLSSSRPSQSSVGVGDSRQQQTVTSAHHTTTHPDQCMLPNTVWLKYGNPPVQASPCM
jgi:hypothetical protein